MFVTIAMGSRDRSFSVWTTNLKRPLFVVNDVFDQSVLDLSWSRDGRLLLACSMDGTVAAVILTEAEIGTRLSQERIDEMMVAQYGKNIGKAALTKSVINAKTNGTNAGPKIIENPDLLKTVNSTDINNGLINGNGHMDATSTNGSSLDKSESAMSANKASKRKLYPKGPTDKQIEAKTSDGRRRITPIYIPPPSIENGEEAENNASINFGNAEFGSSSTQEKSKIAIELKNEIVTPNVSPGKFSNDNSNSLMSQRVNNVNADGSNDKPTSFASIVNGQNDTKATSSTKQNSDLSKLSSNLEISKEKTTESDPTVKSIQNLVKRKPGPHSKIQDSTSAKLTIDTTKSALDKTNEVQKAGKRRAQILSSSEDEDEQIKKPKLDDADDDSSSSIKELKSTSPITKKSDQKENGNEKAKNLKSNKPDLLTASKRPSTVEEGSNSKSQRFKQYNTEAKEIRRPLAASIEVPAVMKNSSATEFSIRLPPLKAYSSRIFNFELNTSHTSSLRQTNTSNDANNGIEMDINGDVKKQHATVSVTNNLIELQGNTGIPGRLHQLVCQIDEDIHQTWRVFFSSPITIVTSGDSLIVVACMDGSIHVFNTANTKTKIGLGEKLYPPFQLPTAISKLKVHKNRLAIVTCCAHLYVWDLGDGPDKMKAILKRESIEYLLQPGNIFLNEDDPEQELDIVKVSKLSFTESDGKVLIVTSAGKTYVFNEDLGVWLKLADTYSWVQSASNYSSAISTQSKTKDNFSMPLASLSYNNAPNPPKLQSITSEVQRLASVTHCQEQAVAALNLGSVQEYRFWYLKYMEHLSQGGMENISQIRGELSCLLRLSRNADNSNRIMSSTEQNDLLKSSLKIIGGNLELQRVYAEYDEQMKFGWGKSNEDVKNVDEMLLD